MTRCEVARSRRAKRRGLLGRDAIDGALLIARCRGVHTMGMRFALDVAHMRSRDHGFVVVKVSTMVPRRLGRLVWRSDTVLEAAAGQFSTWQLRVGSFVELSRT